ncbi:MAG TPA: MFS transporter [Candidatus Acidoferrales bacterium]|nr:MFS transporter [Candidatus Acidoferrales bacterium]
MPDQPSLTEADTKPGIAAAALRNAGLFAGRYRWVICALLFLGVTKNYMDRQVLGILKGPLQHDFGWNEIDYGNLVSIFQLAYAAGMISMGGLIDRLGTRIGYAAAMVFWSLASMAHAAAGSLTSFMVARSALGFGEAGVFPASIKSVAEWFPKKERALATGIFNAGTSVGAMITPLFVPWIAVHLGWRWAFLFTGSIGFLWLAAWLAMYRKPEDHPRCTAEERAYIQSDPVDAPGKIKWVRLVTYRQSWTVIAGKFITDPIWWFYLFWIPDYLQRAHGVRLTQLGLPILVIYAISDFGSVGGGWLSSALIRRGFSVNAARKSAMLVCAFCVLPVAFTFRISGLWPATLLIGLAAAGHQGFSANLYTLTSDQFPVRAVGSVTGIAGMAGAIGGIFIAEVVGHLLQWTGSYMIPFFIAASAYFVGLLVIHLINPKLAPARIS